MKNLFFSLKTITKFNFKMRQFNATMLLMLCVYTESIYSQSWVTVGSPTAGTGGPVWALQTYNGQLYAGGWFSSAGSVLCNSIAAWDGTTWTNPLGLGVDGAVGELCVYNNELIVAGQFNTAGGMAANGLARWNGNTWFSFSPTNYFSGIDDMIVYNGELYVAGSFTTIDNITAYSIAKWNGSTWSAVGQGVQGPINCLEIYNGELYAGGSFSSPYQGLAKWNGSAWSQVDPNFNAHVEGMTVCNNELFISFSGNGNGILVWNGSTMSILPTQSLFYCIPLTLASFNNYLIINGCYSNLMAPVFYNNMSFTEVPLFLSLVPVYEVYQGELYAGGSDQGPYYNMAKLTGLSSIAENGNDSESSTVFPNPATNNITVTWSTPNVNTLTLIDATGRAVRTYSVSGTQAQLSLEGLASGVYFLSAGGETKSVQKIIKQ
jgi:hypothetical protein